MAQQFDVKTVYYTASSLDGFIADRDNGLDWLFQLGDGPPGDFSSYLAQVGAIAMGATTYRWLLDNHIFAGPEAPQPWPYAQPAWVFSSRPQRAVAGADLRFVSGAVAPVHAEMAAAAAGGDLWVVGGGDLAGQFHDAGLLDEIIVDVASVTLGGGAPLLPRSIVTPPLVLESVEQFGSAFARLTYRVARQ
ncbi:MAG: dihydrofolate reductase family protein [Pseudomonadales bacterium]